MSDELITQLFVLIPLIAVIVYFTQRAIARQTAQMEAIVQRVRTDGSLEIEHINHAINSIQTASKQEERDL